VCRALNRIGPESKLSAAVEDLQCADKIVLPGVGHFGRAMAELNVRGLCDALNEAVLEKRKPVLGICLGMELMARRSEEGDAEGLGWLDAKAVKFRFDDRQRYKVPHMGWNTLSPKQDSLLLKGISDKSEFYFAHSYYLKLDDTANAAANTSYGNVFPSAIERDNIFGVQFHPEKSHAAGLQILRNFVAL
jgi:imidazole glycerol-phosphate synthase subunit HisH